MRKTAVALTLIATLLITIAAGVSSVKLAQANPYLYHEHVSPPAGSIPLVISILSPRNGDLLNVRAVTLAFDVKTEGTSLSTISAIYFEASWLQEKVTVYEQNTYSPAFPSFCSYNETFGNIPDGNYTIAITARGGGGYAEGLTAYSFDMTTTSIVPFIILTSPEVSILSPLPEVSTLYPLPEVSILSPLNETLSSSEIALNFSVNKSFSKISYVLDDQDNMTINGNVTLTGLTDGVHNVTVYAWDAAGNIGSSETVTFIIDVPESFPTIFVSAVSVALVTTVTAGLLFYYKKRRREAEQA
jgi:hypothetical protein